jgi:hypothetical protein
MWTGRVLHYTDNYVTRGYDVALSYLKRTISDYRIEASRRPAR